ncbi:phosphoribulokinase [Betaproteobacteria bacterium]|nr:phosphoribulokinase [Betaproteobacteria bacterium]GHU44223.1 phosphoribulokinase [Betaproteobacteria bacterium]
MSTRHPIIAITGSSGAGTSTVRQVFESMFRREGVNAAIIDGDSFHRYERAALRRMNEARAGNGELRFSLFGPETNLFSELENLFRTYAETGTGQRRYYLHDKEEADRHGQTPGTFTPWEALPPDTDLLFYEGLHGAVRTPEVDVARHPDLLIGIAPVVNLEWIQKIHRDTRMRGYSREAVMQTILARMPDYVHYIVPQFELTHINFQRVPLVDTSNPIIARSIPEDGESLVVIRFADPRGVDFPYLLSMIKDSFMSRANTIVIPGDRQDLAMQLIFTPLIWRLMARKGHPD